MSNVDPTALAAALARLKSVDAAPGLDSALGQVVDVLVDVFAVTGAGLMFLDAAKALRYVVSSDQPGRVLESAQEELGYGPCVDALVLDRHVLTEDVAADERWPRLGELVGPNGVHAVLGVPVHVARGAVGSLNVYYDRPHAWDESEVAALGAFNKIIERLIEGAVFARRQGEVVGQLQYALDNRVVVERAIGLLMGRDGIDAVTAFDRLRREARASRRKVAELAEELLAGVAGVPLDPTA